jgi:peptidoglycan/LPS O-acetylase OafA/YrhL
VLGSFVFSLSDSIEMAPKRILSLDLLRAVAVLLVLGRHIVVIPKIGQPTPELFQFFQIWKRIGWVGVDLFFVLSGFLVSGLLFKEFQRHQSISMKGFLIRRGLKIYPLFYLLLLFSLFVFNVVLKKNAPLELFLREAFFIQNYWFGIWGHTWSLAVEEHFYLLLILVISGLARLQPKSANPFVAIVPFYLIIAIGCLVWRVYLAEGNGFSGFTFVSPTHLRIDTLLLGRVLSYLYHYHREMLDRLLTGRGWYLLACGLMLLLPVTLTEMEYTPWVYTYGFTLYAYGCAMLLLGMQYIKLPDVFVLRLFASLGVYSYSIYLLHMPVAYWMTSLCRWVAGAERAEWFSFEVLALIYLFFSIAFGVLFSRLIEWPILKLRERWSPSRIANTAGPTGVDSAAKEA